MMMPPLLVRYAHSSSSVPLICNYKTAEKGQFIRKSGLAGFSMWETGGDYNNILTKSIRSAMGKPP